MDSGTQLVLAWKWRNGALVEWWVPLEQYPRIAALAPYDPTISLVGPAHSKKVA